MYFWLHFNTQYSRRFFQADSGANGGGNEGGMQGAAEQQGAVGGADERGKNEITFTPEQQKKIDEIIKTRLAREREKLEVEAAEKIRKEQEKAELEKLQGEERLKKERELFEKQRAEFLRKQREFEASKLLDGAGLKLDDEETSSFLLSVVTGEDDSKTLSNIESLQNVIDKLVQKRLDGKLRESAGGLPGNPKANKDDDIDRDKLSDEEWYKRYAQKKNTT